MTIRRFHHSGFDLGRLLEHKTEPITAVLPAREVADTIGQIVERLGLDPLIDQIVVVDANSRDGTARRPALAPRCTRVGSSRVRQVLGKGDAMWRALDVVRGELVVYLDSDTRDFSPHFATGMLGPLLCEPGLRFVKAFFRRPYVRPDGGAAPPTAAVKGSWRRARSCRRSIPSSRGSCSRWPVRWRRAASSSIASVRHRLRRRDGDAPPRRDALGSTEGMAQVDLDVRLNRHQPLTQLGPMAYAVLRVILERLREAARRPRRPSRRPMAAWCRSSSWSGRRMRRSALGA